MRNVVMKGFAIKSFFTVILLFHSIFSFEILDIQPREGVPNVTKIHVTMSEFTDKVYINLIDGDWKKSIVWSSCNNSRTDFIFYIPKGVLSGSYKLQCKARKRDPGTGNPFDDEIIIDFQVNPEGGCGYQPVIQEIKPEGGGSGSQYIIISGEHFCDSRGENACVIVNNNAIEDDNNYIDWTDNFIKVISPSGLSGSISVKVTNRIGLISNTMNIDFISFIDPAVIYSSTLDYYMAGESVYLFGMNFGTETGSIEILGINGNWEEIPSENIYYWGLHQQPEFLIIMGLPNWTTSGFLRINRPDGVLGYPWPIIGGNPSASFFKNYDGTSYTILGDAFGEQEGDVFICGNPTIITEWNKDSINGLLPQNFTGGIIQIFTAYWGEGFITLNENSPETPVLAISNTLHSHPVLSWTVNSESDIDHYILKKKYTNVSDQSTWTTFVDPAYNQYTDTYMTFEKLGTTLAEYWVKSIGINGIHSSYSNKKSCTGIGPAWKRVPADSSNSLILLPKEYKISNPYPNPFNNTTSFLVELPEETLVSVSVFDINGTEIWNNKGKYSSGYHIIQWDGKNNIGVNVPSGVYLFVFRTLYSKHTLKVILMK